MICRAVDNLLENTANINGENGMSMQRLGKLVSLVAIVEADMFKRGAMGQIIPIPIRVCHNAIHLARSATIVPPTRALLEYVRDEEAADICDRGPSLLIKYLAKIISGEQASRIRTKL